MKIETILNRYLVVTQKMADLKKEADDLKKQADKQIGPDNRLDVGDYAFIRETRYTKRYSPLHLRTVLADEDAFNSCLAPDNKLVKKVLKGQKIGKDLVKYLDDNMEIISESSAIKVQKIKTKA